MKILIPSYEPNEKLVDLVEQIKELTNIPIIVVNDGSGENYNEIFETLKTKGVTVLKHQTNQGKGAAIKTGIKYLIKNNEKQGCVCADSDGQHTVKDILRICEELEKDKKDIVLGVRNFKKENIPFRSKFGNNISKILFYAMTGEKVRDTQTGLRGYSSKIFEWLLAIDGNRYEYEFNILLKMKEEGITYTQIDIETIYEDKNECSHFRVIRDSILIYKPVCKFLISSVLSAIIDFVLLMIFQMFFNNLLLAVICSRSISSIFNFILNKNYVFDKKESKNAIRMAGKYFSLVIIIMIFNYLILNLLNTIIGIDLVISKIITEIILYSFSFIAQKRVVFKNRKEK